MKETVSYTSKWEEYRKRSRLFWVVFLMYVPGVALISVPLCKAFNSSTPGFIVAGIWMAVGLILHLRTMFWRCPRCDKYFFCNWWYGNRFARKCVHCKLPKWATTDQLFR